MEPIGDDVAGAAVEHEGRALALRNLAFEVAGQIVGATIALGGTPIAAILGAASSPLITAAATRISERRAQTLQQRLARAGLTPEETLRRVLDSPAALDMFRIAVRAALESEIQSKRSALGDSLARGLMSGDELTVNVEMRFMRTLERLEAPELGILQVLEAETGLKSGHRAGAVSQSDLVSRFPQMAALIDAVVAPLEAEGLVRQTGGSARIEWSITDYGLHVLNELRHAETEAADEIAEPASS